MLRTVFSIFFHGIVIAINGSTACALDQVVLKGKESGKATSVNE